jgi:uncharacterized protein (TIGR00375 family)
MDISVDLHSHSGYAGGVGKITLEDVSKTMKLKGIDIFGTGDSLFPPRTKFLRENLTGKDGIYYLKNDDAKFVLQTEVIFTTNLENYKNRIVAHHIILFPDFQAISKMQKLLEKWGMKNTIGRPFITNENKAQLVERLFEIKAIDPYLEIIPAHVMTPEGIMGSKNSLNSIKEFYGDFTSEIKAIETGLSADPKMLERIPDFANLTMISNSDCHSSALNRIGREFTTLEMKEMNYFEMINSIRENRVKFTAEFNPKEGKFFGTGHRKNRYGHSKPYFYEGDFEENLICPVCQKKMNIGVDLRTKFLIDENIIPLKRKFLYLIPLIEVIAYSLKIKNIKAIKVVKNYNKIMSIFPNEISIWKSTDSEIEEQLDKDIDAKIVSNILAVKNGNFAFNPPGYDGEYGVLEI